MAPSFHRDWNYEDKMRPLRIAIVGCGTAGPACALFLERQGHDVTIYERVPDPQPVGAGILLQPTGMRVLEELGILPEILSHAERIERLRGVTKTGRVVLSLDYEDYERGCAGAGLHRGTLFTLLLRSLLKTSVRLVTGVEVTECKKQPSDRYSLWSEQVELGVYDLIVVADGARSALRGHSKLIKRVDMYPWGALWAVFPDESGLSAGTLSQVYDGARRMAGILPTGCAPDQTSGPRLSSLFWSIRANRVDAWRAAGIDAWRRELLSIWPALAPLVELLIDPDQLTFAPYFDVRMKCMYEGGVVYIGDAAHAMSPQLGQGANLALYDAWVLAETLKRSDSLSDALSMFWRARRAHVRYYQYASRYLTPFFQSESSTLSTLRDLTFGWMCRFPPTRAQMLASLVGVKNGLFTKEK